MTATRTDRHRPSADEFDPQDYAFTGVVHDNTPDFPQTNADFLNVRGHLLDQGYTFSGIHGGTGQCDHCGSYLRYSALMIHVPTRTLIYVGEQCLDNRFEAMTKDEFNRARRNAQLARESRHLLIAFNQLCDGDQDLTYATYAGNIGAALVDGKRWEDTFRADYPVSTVVDIMKNVREYGNITPRQAAFVVKMLDQIDNAEAVKAAKDAERTATAAARPNAAIGELGERRVFEGTVRWFENYAGNYGWTTVMIIDTAEGTVKWKASKKLAFKRNESVKIKATVKSHDIYKHKTTGVEQITTIVTKGTFL